MNGFILRQGQYVEKSAGIRAKDMIYNGCLEVYSFGDYLCVNGIHINRYQFFWLRDNVNQDMIFRLYFLGNNICKININDIKNKSFDMFIEVLAKRGDYN